jgi:hypothetical protein
MPRLLPRLALLFGLCMLSGCADKPTLRLHHAELRSASLRGVGLDVYMTVNNPNSFDIQIRNVRVVVEFAGRYALPEILDSPNQWLPAGESTILRVPVAIPFAIVPSLVNETARSPELRYTVKGSADVTAVRALGVEKDDYPIDEAGVLSRSALLAAAGI